VGLEVGCTPTWSLGVVFDHVLIGDVNISFSVVNPIVAGATNRITQDVDMLTLRVNYRFGSY
jgi:outer membrane immunogenic protein